MTIEIEVTLIMLLLTALLCAVAGLAVGVLGGFAYHRNIESKHSHSIVNQLLRKNPPWILE